MNREKCKNHKSTEEVAQANSSRFGYDGISDEVRRSRITPTDIRIKSLKGFTLLEMIVAVGVFSVAAVLGVSSYLALTAAQKKALTLQSVQDNLRFAIETMASDIRAGNFYYCGGALPLNAPPTSIVDSPPWNSADVPPKLPWAPSNCPIGGSPGSSITFVRRGNSVIVYRSGDCNGGHYCIERGEAIGAIPTTFTPITSQDVEIGDATNQGLRFYVVGAKHGDYVPGRVTIFIHGTAHAGGQASTFDLQTSVTQLQFLRSLQ
jgi:prepilin-type N-terminal cleavage/methylation domain-containing protein